MAEVNSVSAVVKDGKIQNAANNKENKEKTNQAKGYDKDSFLKILVAQMKYQDPMEPTSNTEYISQYATFTQVEQMNNMANAMSLSRASEMVGKTVTVTQTNPETHETTDIQGVVDFVTYSGNKAYLNINGTNYNVDDVTQILGEDYENALNTVKDFQENIDKLPDNISLVTLEEHEKTIDSMYDYYMNMDEKAKRLMDKDYVTSLLQYVNRIDDLNNSEHRTFNKDKQTNAQEV